jgi:hypothetical protein
MLFLSMISYNNNENNYNFVRDNRFTKTVDK